MTGLICTGTASRSIGTIYQVQRSLYDVSVEFPPQARRSRHTLVVQYYQASSRVRESRLSYVAFCREENLNRGRFIVVLAALHRLERRGSTGIRFGVEHVSITALTKVEVHPFSPAMHRTF